MLDILRAILRFLGQVLEWVVDFFQWLFVKVAVLVFDAVIAVLSAIPVPDWLDDLAGNIANIDPGVMFFVAPLQIETGLTWLLSAYLLRFLIRRLPVVG